MSLVTSTVSYLVKFTDVIHIKKEIDGVFDVEMILWLVGLYYFFEIGELIRETKPSLQR